MASYRRQKAALRTAIYAYFAGAHHITEEVERTHGLSPSGSSEEATEMRHAMLEADFERLRESGQSLEMFADILDEEQLYPFGSEWPRDALAMLAVKLVPPRLSSESGGESDLKFRFKKGFKELLADLAGSIEGLSRQTSTLDHWMVLLINAAFHGGAVVAARNAENPKLYYDILSQLEEETEPWTRYPQLAEQLDRQLRTETRRKTGLVSDLDY